MNLLGRSTSNNEIIIRFSIFEAFFKVFCLLLIAITKPIIKKTMVYGNTKTLQAIDEIKASTIIST